MHDDRRLTEARVQRVLGERVWPAVYTDAVPLEVARWDAPGEPVPASEALAASYEPARVGQEWGPAWATTWFRLRGRVPRAWAGRRVEAVVDLGFEGANPGFQCEGLVHLPDGTVVKGLHPRNSWVAVGSPAQGGEAVELYVEAAANPVILGDPPFRPTALGGGPGPGDEPLYRLRRADLAVFEAPVWELAMDIEVVTGVMRELDTGDPRRWELLRALELCLDALDLQDVPGSAEGARAALAPALRSPATASAHRVSAVGHAHIDSAWLWPLRETVRKVARTSANVVALMEEHPELVFAMSQAQQWAWLKEHRPDVFARVKEAGGRFVPVGGMWVESDTNMPGSEALARQFSFGKRFFRDELGVDTQEVWLPDSFGYSAALPQLIRLSGSRWFLTQKISWSQTNRFPHHTFWWEGIDGTRVFTHFPPADTYNSELTGAELAHASRNFRDKGRASRSLVPFGHGDGGGGPTREMLARAARQANLEGSPRVSVEHPEDFFAKAHEEYPDAPVWLGELYLEFHRGTYTSQAATKQGNRRCEHLLREAELWAATAAVRAGEPYPHERLERIWRTVLLNQFHDILPGSSIAWVHREAAASYAEAAAELEEVIASAQSALTAPPASEASAPGGTVVFNAAPHERDGIPALGARRLAGADAPASPDSVVSAAEEGFVLDNGLLTVRVDRRGLVTSVLDRVGDREVLAPGRAANLLQLHQDLPNQWDAWDVDSFYRNTVVDLTGADAVEVVDREGVAALRVARSFGASSLVQVLWLEPGAHRLDVETVVDWHEREKFLKASFPLDVRAHESSSEIQFGHVRRPTHTNTSWDAARFEICAHRWVHVAEPGYGAALVNDSTYGHDVTRDVRGDGGTTTTVRLSLLRAPRFPDPETDQGTHRLRYALVPGASVVDAVREGYRINLPARGVAGSAAVEPLVRVSDPGVVVESVKLADDRSGDVVVRLYEARGGRTRAAVRADFAVTGVRAVDLLEEEFAQAPALEVEAGADSGRTIGFDLRPFQILTLRLSR